MGFADDSGIVVFLSAMRGEDFYEKNDLFIAVGDAPAGGLRSGEGA